MTNTDVRPLRNGAAWSCDVDERGATGTLPGWRKAGKVIDADNEHLIARQADRAVDVADGTGPASSRTATPGRQSRQARRCFVRQSLRHSRPLPRTPSRGLAAALRGLTQEGLIIIIYDQIQTDDEGVVSQPEYTFEKPSSGPNDRDHLSQLLREHLRTSRGWHRIADNDRPARTPPKTLALLAAAKRAGPAISAVCDHIHRHEGAAGVRRILGVLSLARKHGPAVVEDAATAALELGVPTYRFLKRYLDRHHVAPLALRQVDPLIRELTVYRDLIDRRTGDRS